GAGGGGGGGPRGGGAPRGCAAPPAGLGGGGGAPRGPPPPPPRGPPPRLALRSSLAAGLDPLFLQPEAEGAKGRLVADLEEAGWRRGRDIPVLDPVPGRRRDAVSLLPAKGLVADAALAAPLDDVEDGA